jgi:site-specific DNA recombinase
MRRAEKWTGSGIRAILLNDRYRGRVVWNRTEWRKDPDSGKRIAIEHPRSQWIVHHDEALRIATDAVFDRALERFVRDTTGKWTRPGARRSSY